MIKANRQYFGLYLPIWIGLQYSTINLFKRFRKTRILWYSTGSFNCYLILAHKAFRIFNIHTEIHVREFHRSNKAFCHIMQITIVSPGRISDTNKSADSIFPALRKSQNPRANSSTPRRIRTINFARNKCDWAIQQKRSKLQKRKWKIASHRRKSVAKINGRHIRDRSSPSRQPLPQAYGSMTIMMMYGSVSARTIRMVSKTIQYNGGVRFFVVRMRDGVVALGLCVWWMERCCWLFFVWWICFGEWSRVFWYSVVL